MKNKLSNERIQQIKKYAIFAVMGIIFVGSMWWLFASSEADKEKEQIGIGYNTEIPDPNGDGIIGDKKDAYEQEQMKAKQAERMKSLQDMGYMFDEQTGVESNDLNLMDNPQTNVAVSTSKRKQNTIQSSNMAYQDINRTLGNFYEKPKDDPEKEELKQRLEELESKLGEKDDKQSTMDEQLALMEKSYELAAKYMPQADNPNQPFQNSSSANNESLKSKIENGSFKGQKATVTAVNQVREQVVSSLAQQLTNDDILYLYDRPRNFGFNTLNAKVGVSAKNTISACVQGDQTLLDGESIRLRLLESLMAGKTHIPTNSIITGIAKIQGERLDILISSLEYKGEIIPVEMIAYDTDAQKGIYIPGSMEMNAIKEVAANMGQSMGTSISITDNATSQIAADLTKGLIQGTSQYMTKKIKQVKVTLKSGYKLYLLPKKNN